MIFDIDHVGLSTTREQLEVEKMLFKLGYTKQFEEGKLENLNIKKPYLRDFKPTHAISLYRKENSYNIELINHFTELKGFGFASPMLSINKKYNATISQKIHDYLCNKENFPVEIIDPGLKLDKLIVETFNLQSTLMLFRKLGFKQVEKADNKNIVSFKSFMGKIYFIEIQKKTKSQKRYFLDNIGFNSLGVLTNNIEKDIAKLSQQGFEITQILNIIVNKKQLKIGFVIGHNSELIELIEIK